MKNSNTSFSWGKTFLIGFGFLGISLIWSLYSAYVPIFLKERLLLSTFAVGLLVSGNNLLTTLLLPYFGALSDRTRSRLGRRLPFILLGTPLACLFVVMIPYAAQAKSFAWMMVALWGMTLSMGIYRVPVVALMPDLTPSKFRSQANGIINLAGGLGSLLAFFGGKFLYDIGISLPFIAAAVISLLAMFLLWFIARETQAEEKSEGGSWREMKESLAGIVRGERSMLFILSANFIWSAGFAAISSFMTSYTKFHLGMDESIGARILGIFALAFMAAAIGAGYLGSQYGRGRAIIVGLLVMGGVFVAVPQMHGLLSLEGLFALTGLAWALIVVNALPMVLDMAPGKNAGVYTGLYYLASQTGSIFAPMLAGGLIDHFGYNSLMILCSLTFLAAAGFMALVKRGESVEGIAVK